MAMLPSPPLTNTQLFFNGAFGILLKAAFVYLFIPLFIIYLLIYLFAALLQTTCSSLLFLWGGISLPLGCSYWEWQQGTAHGQGLCLSYYFISLVPQLMTLALCHHIHTLRLLNNTDQYTRVCSSTLFIAVLHRYGVVLFKFCNHGHLRLVIHLIIANRFLTSICSVMFSSVCKFFGNTLLGGVCIRMSKACH